MTDDHDSGPVEKAKEAKDKVAEKLAPTDEELRKAGHHGAGGSTGDSEAVAQSPTGG